MIKNYQDEIEKIGVEIATTLCNSLISKGVDGLHFYTMNQWQISDTLCRNLGLPVKAL